ncbi:GGDEF domain-containing protein [Shewanella waksmanii]|uniref:GGDEF domain-containing protein n=1 Tax=Shewanella waksmanii TaxID=213783 RepID=UPI00048FB9F4|nr:GGDEF domain-containing protein [Shewanella waksmanii]
MLPDTIDTGLSLLEDDHAQINLVRWMHQCELMKRYYQSEAAFVAQRTDLGFEVIVGSANPSRKFISGTLYDDNLSLFDTMSNSDPDGLSIDLTQYIKEDVVNDLGANRQLISRPILWPDGSVFGCLCVVEPNEDESANINAFMLEPFQILLQQDLALLCQSQRIESLSMRDRETGMLNHYGFIMMAPRQLNLGRRFGAHAGILMFELDSQSPQIPQIEDKHNRLLGGIIQDTIRTADIAAHYSNDLFIVLVFVDSERDLQHIYLRIEKLLTQQNPNLLLDRSHSFFAPDSPAKLAPMIEAAKSGLKSYQQQPQETE